ncbi:hypothetical protein CAUPRSCDRAFT_10578 [Caulochytrium protostelioides]|uniref:Uncharacterized protein n=1 Tax=Caulochytrium protostelioides TaxID=1555241 RepID=A0A4P9X141_9FUNG|nr:hypothetical protein CAUPRSCDRAFT_10578 [Caulochytrium protostelioides]
MYDPFATPPPVLPAALRVIPDPPSPRPTGSCGALLPSATSPLIGSAPPNTYVGAMSPPPLDDFAVMSTPHAVAAGNEIRWPLPMQAPHPRTILKQCAHAFQTSHVGGSSGIGLPLPLIASSQTETRSSDSSATLMQSREHRRRDGEGPDKDALTGGLGGGIHRRAEEIDGLHRYDECHGPTNVGNEDVCGRRDDDDDGNDHDGNANPSGSGGVDGKTDGTPLAAYQGSPSPPWIPRNHVPLEPLATLLMPLPISSLVGSEDLEPHGLSTPAPPMTEGPATEHPYSPDVVGDMADRQLPRTPAPYAYAAFTAFRDHPSHTPRPHMPLLSDVAVAHAVIGTPTSDHDP